MSAIKKMKKVRKRGAQRGMTLIEVMVSVAIFTVVMGVLFGIATSIGDTAIIQNEKVTANQQVRQAMSRMTREIRQATRSGIQGLPGPSITYQVPLDVDGNGTAVNVSIRRELSQQRTIQRDINDANGDGITATQLVLIAPDLVSSQPVQVLANGLLEDEDVNQNQVLDDGEDLNGNGILDRGIWFDYDDQRVRISVQTRGFSRQGLGGKRQILVSGLTQSVLPRNG